MSVLLNACLAVDLILMIKFPFKNKDHRVPVYLAVSLVILTANYLISYASIIYAFRKLCKPGISKESQRLVLLRHVLSIIGFTIT
jgi:hypothetical protein